jgi:hypothetical protein
MIIERRRRRRSLRVPLPDAVPVRLGFLLLLFGSLVASAVAVVLTATTRGRGATRTLLGRLLRWRIGLRWYLVLLGPRQCAGRGDRVAWVRPPPAPDQPQRPRRQPDPRVPARPLAPAAVVAGHPGPTLKPVSRVRHSSGRVGGDLYLAVQQHGKPAADRLIPYRDERTSDVGARPAGYRQLCSTFLADGRTAGAGSDHRGGCVRTR